jgi:hypothetical protein
MTSSLGRTEPGRAGAAPAVKAYTRGTHRVVSPAATLARLLPLLPSMGITRLANVTGLDTIGIPVVMAVRPNGRALSVAQGKDWISTPPRSRRRWRRWKGSTPSTSWGR